MFNGFELNIIPSILGIIIYVAIGAIWYSPMFLGKVWMQLKGITTKDLEDNGKIMGLAIISAIISVVVLNLMTFWSQVTTLNGGLVIAIIATLFVSTVGFNSVCFDKKEGFETRFRLWLIDAGNTLTTFTIIAILFAVWN